jgi:hypothetical protein
MKWVCGVGLVGQNVRPGRRPLLGGLHVCAVYSSYMGDMGGS